jgi:hypothetical protein
MNGRAFRCINNAVDNRIGAVHYTAVSRWISQVYLCEAGDNFIIIATLLIVVKSVVVKFNIVKSTHIERNTHTQFLYPHTTKLCMSIMFLTRRSVRPCVIICCRLDSTYICRSIFTKLWEVVSNSKTMNGIDIQKNLSRGSLFWEGDLVKFLICCHLYRAPSFVDWFTWNWEKLSVRVKTWMGLSMDRIAPQKNL